MRLNISAWSIRNPVPSIVLFVVLTFLGIASFKSLPVTRFNTAEDWDCWMKRVISFAPIEKLCQLMMAFGALVT